MNNPPSSLDTLPDSIFVIYNRKRNSVLFDKMTQQPLYSPNPKILEAAARAFHGSIITRREAIRLILKHTYSS